VASEPGGQFVFIERAFGEGEGAEVFLFGRVDDSESVEAEKALRRS
jgi:hypothetical protein